MSHPDYRLARAHKFLRITGGDYTLNSTTWANVDTSKDITLSEVEVGDDIEISLSGLLGSAGVTTSLDVVSLVSGAAVNSWARATGLPSNTEWGPPAWYEGNTAEESPKSGLMTRTVTSDDLASGGILTLRLRYRQGAATNRTLFASALVPFMFQAKDLGPQDPY